LPAGQPLVPTLERYENKLVKLYQFAGGDEYGRGLRVPQVKIWMDEQFSLLILS
jgi:hypothetical protein